MGTGKARQRLGLRSTAYQYPEVELFGTGSRPSGIHNSKDLGRHHASPPLWNQAMAQVVLVYLHICSDRAWHYVHWPPVHADKAGRSPLEYINTRRASPSLAVSLRRMCGSRFVPPGNSHLFPDVRGTNNAMKPCTHFQTSPTSYSLSVSSGASTCACAPNCISVC